MDTVRVLHVPDRSVSPYRADLKALYILRENIQSLLSARRESQTALATHVGHQRAWINKFLNDRDAASGREVSIRDLDKIATFFGLATYQLFQPGISALTERRSAVDRRTGRDRRVGHIGRHLATLRSELDKLPHASPAASRAAAAVPEPVQRVLAAAERQIAAIYAELGRQAASTGTEGAVVPGARRKLRGPVDKPAG